MRGKESCHPRYFNEVIPKVLSESDGVADRCCMSYRLLYIYHELKVRAKSIHTVGQMDVREVMTLLEYGEILD